LLSYETVVIDGSKFRAENSDNNCFVRSNVVKLIAQAEERIAHYLSELDDNDNSERRSEQLTKKEIGEVLEYLDKRKVQLADAMAQIDEKGGNQVCVTDPECRLMKTRDGCKPSFNVQTAVEPDNHIIVNFDVTNECTDWNLLEAGINASKETLGVETLEGIADKGYGSDDEILKCLLNGDTPTIYPNKGQNCRIFKFEKTDDEITPKMLSSKDHETMKKCISAGFLPDVLKRDDITMEITGKHSANSSLFIHKETGEIVSYREMCAAGGRDREEIDIHREPPLQPYFERDSEKDIVVCPMGQMLFYAGPGSPNGKKDVTLRRYHRASVCKHCLNKCTVGKRRVISFKPGETRITTSFYDKCKLGKITRRSNRTFKSVQQSPEERSWDARVIIRYYPNQHRLRMRNQIVEHPYGTVKRWNDGYYLLLRGKVKAAADLAFSFLGYNFKRALNILGTQGLMELMNAQ